MRRANKLSFIFPHLICRKTNQRGKKKCVARIIARIIRAFTHLKVVYQVNIFKISRSPTPPPEEPAAVSS